MPEGWVLVDDQTRALMQEALSKEVSSEHILSGKNPALVARCVGCDEVLIFVEVLRRWALVHMTWRGSPELLPYPFTRMFDQTIPYEAMREHAEHVTDD